MVSRVYVEKKPGFNGEARALAAGIEGSYNHQWTISALQVHPNGILVCDDPAAEELRVATYRYFKDIERENLISK